MAISILRCDRAETVGGYLIIRGEDAELERSTFLIDAIRIRKVVSVNAASPAGSAGEDMGAVLEMRRGGWTPSST